jgi:tetratricopeptide (TPR) repeat protein
VAVKGKEWLDWMDKLRLDQPQRVIRAIEESIPDEIEKSLIPQAYMIYGAALRQRSRLREAHHAYYDGLQLVRAARDLPAQADLTERLAVIAAAREDFRLALAVSKEAISLYLRCQDLSGAGKALTDQGMYFYYLEEYEESISANKAALSYLSLSEKNHIYMAWVGQALAYRKLSDPVWALASIRRADDIAQELGPVIASRSKWFTGRFHLDLGEFAAAEQIFGELLHLYLGSGHILDAVLAGVDQTRSLLALGRSQEATVLAQSLRDHVIALPEDSIAAAGILEIWRLSSKRRLTLEVLEKISEAIERERGETPHPLSTI